ncbi:hypothetical protein [Virgibacillus siamensis]|uniref:hypothetical protein n=1 Tax=Virgibacillus siamensis TaxID=480071 RepID=UPI000986AF51|nr:hypothetical protein [Virgibacillus siamensis]
MKTCAYCGTQLTSSYCDFCEMELSERYILRDGERLSNSIDFYPEQQGIFKNTPELLQLETIELLCLLRHARNYRSVVYKLRILGHKAEAEGGNMEEIQIQSYSDYEAATRKVWVLENIIKDRIGYYPQKVTENFLTMYLNRIEKSKFKKMTMKKVVVKNGS